MADLELRDRSTRRKDLIFNVLAYAGFVLFDLAVVYPFWYILVNSFNADLVYGTAFFFPTRLSLTNYEAAFADIQIVNALLVTLIRVALGTVLAVLVNAMCAFALRKRNLKFRGFLLTLFTIPLFFGGGLIPYYLTLRNVGLIDSFLVFIIPSVFSFFYVILLMSAFNDVSDSMEESAHMDGAGYFTIFTRIYAPMCVPVLVTIALFNGVSHWQSWFDSLYFTRKRSLVTFAAFLIRIIQKWQVTAEEAKILYELKRAEGLVLRGMQFASMVIGILPVLVVYPFMQKYFVKGVRIGSIKG